MTDKARNPRALNALKGAVPASAQIQMRIPPDIKSATLRRLYGKE